MKLPSPAALGALYGISEVCLAFTRRAGGGTVSRDRNSLRVLWGVILVSVFLIISSPAWFPFAALPYRRTFYFVGLGLFVIGIFLRWYSISYLGRYFTVDVAIADEHRVIDTGPYRLIRHPSYTGALLAFIGFGLCIGNWMSILCVLPVVAAFMWRIHVEEGALIDALGENYLSYMRRSKRLLPFVY